MNYSISSEDFRNAVLANTLRVLADCYAEIGGEVFVVGATAHDIALRLLGIDEMPRRTLDLDVAVLLKEWRQYDHLTQILLAHGFVKAKQRQHFYYVGEDASRYEVDVVPFGAIARDEFVAWPPEEATVMSVRCFEDVLSHADRVEVDRSYSFKIASLSGQFLIKLDAWLDRHSLTGKDAADMIFILNHLYVAYALSRNGLPEEIDLDATHFDILVASAEWIASDMRKMLSDEHKKFYADFFQNEYDKEDESELLNDLLDETDGKRYDVLRRAMLRLAQILRD